MLGHEMTEAASTTTPDETVEAAEQEPTLLDRIRGYLPWIGGALVLMALFRALRWWGDQQQRAALRGRAWPPLPVRVFLRGS